MQRRSKHQSEETKEITKCQDLRLQVILKGNDNNNDNNNNNNTNKAIYKLGTVTKHLEKWIGKLDFDLTIEALRKPCLLEMGRE